MVNGKDTQRGALLTAAIMVLISGLGLIADAIFSEPTNIIALIGGIIFIVVGFLIIMFHEILVAALPVSPKVIATALGETLPILESIFKHQVYPDKARVKEVSKGIVRDTVLSYLEEKQAELTK